MSPDIILPSPPASETPPVPEALVLPRSEFPVLNTNSDTRMVWMGFPIDKMMPLDIMLLCDSAKKEVVMFQRECMAAKSKIAVVGGGPSSFQKLKGFLRKTGKV